VVVWFSVGAGVLDQGERVFMMEAEESYTEWKRLLERAVALEAQLFSERTQGGVAGESFAAGVPASHEKLGPFLKPRFPPAYRNLNQLESESQRLLKQTGATEAGAESSFAGTSTEHARAHALLAQRGFDPDRIELQAKQVDLVEDVEYLEPFAETDLDTWLRLQHEWAVLELCELARHRTDSAAEALWEDHAAASWEQRRKQLLSLLGSSTDALNLRDILSYTGGSVDARSLRSRTQSRARSASPSGAETSQRTPVQLDRRAREHPERQESSEPHSGFERECAALVLALVRQAPDSRSQLSESAHITQWSGLDISTFLSGQVATSVVGAADLSTDLVALRFARAARKWSQVRTAASWPHVSYSEACYEILCAMLGEGDLTATLTRPDSFARKQPLTHEYGPFRAPAEGMLRPSRGHRLRFVCGALDWLQRQFHQRKLRLSIEREPEMAALGGKTGTLAEVRAYLRVMEAGTMAVSRPTGWLTEDPFAEIYYCLRCGDIGAAVEAAKDWLSPEGKHYSGDDLPRFLTYLESFEQSARRRWQAIRRANGGPGPSEAGSTSQAFELRGLRGSVKATMLSQMIHDYGLFVHKSQLRSGYRDWSVAWNANAQEEQHRLVERDIFKRVCYVLIGRFNSAAPEGMELLDMDYDVLFASIEDYLWMRLWTCRLSVDECDGELGFISSERSGIDEETLADERLPPEMSTLELPLDAVQEEMRQFGSAHFDPHGNRPHFYAMILLLTCQFEAALTYLVYNGVVRASASALTQDPLVDAVHLGLILNYYGALTEYVQQDSDLVLYDYAAILWRYLQREQREVSLAKADPTAAAAYLMTIRDAEQRFACLCKLVTTTREFSLLLGAMIPGTLRRRPGVIERLERTAYTTRQLAGTAAEWARVAYACAESCEITGDVIHAAMLFELAGDLNRVMSILIRALCSTYLDHRFYQNRLPQPVDMERQQLELAKQAQSIYEKYEHEGVLSRREEDGGHRSSDQQTSARLSRSLAVALKLARFIALVYDEAQDDSDPDSSAVSRKSVEERYEAALELQKQLGLLPFSRSQLTAKVEALRPGAVYEDALVERLPVVVLTLMRVVHVLYENTKTALRTGIPHKSPAEQARPSERTVLAWRSSMEQRLAELKEIASTLVTFSGMIPFMTAAETSELVRLEMTLT
jgi:hypothetical protein